MKFIKIRTKVHHSFPQFSHQGKLALIAEMRHSWHIKDKRHLFSYIFWDFTYFVVCPSVSVNFHIFCLTTSLWDFFLHFSFTICCSPSLAFLLPILGIFHLYHLPNSTLRLLNYTHIYQLVIAEWIH